MSVLPGKEVMLSQGSHGQGWHKNQDLVNENKPETKFHRMTPNDNILGKTKSLALSWGEMMDAPTGSKERSSDIHHRLKDIENQATQQLQQQQEKECVGCRQGNKDCLSHLPNKDVWRSPGSHNPCCKDRG